MHVVDQGVTPGRKARGTKLPPEIAAGAALLTQFQTTGRVARLEPLLRLSRRGGYGGLELFAFAVTYLSAGPQSSIRAFLERHGAFTKQLAALVGRRNLPTQASLSRALGGLSASTVDAFTDEVLPLPLGFNELLSHPAAAHRDANGLPWHVFDFDPTTRPFRQRDLPEGDDLPAGQRRVEAVPGYVGRKRGEVRQQDHLLQHSGTGLWMFYRLNASGGSATPYLASAVRVARERMDQIGHPAARTLVRCDGEFGHARAIRACADQGVQHLVRLARYKLFDREDVKQALAAARWRPVPHSSVAKMAADLGTVRLDDGEGGASVDTRLIVTRFPTTAGEPQRGVLQQGFQVELFATSLPADAWPAEDVVTLYAGRNTIENSFAQEDREFDLGRTFSYSALGQAFFVAVGLFLWNHQICAAATALRVPERLPAQDVRLPEEGSAQDARVPEFSPVVNVAKPMAVAPPGLSPQGPASSSSPALEAVMRQAAQGRKLREGWSFDDQTGLVRCPAGKPLHAYHAESTTIDADGARVGSDRISLRSAVGACDGCPLRSTCFTSPKSKTYKQLTWMVSHDLARVAKDALFEARRSAPPRAVRAPPHPHKPFTPFRAVPAGLLVPTVPTFSPGAARRRTREALRHVAIEVFLGQSRARRASNPLLRSPGSRRGSRLTWSERAHRARCHEDVLIIATAPPHARRLLQFHATPSSVQR